MTLLQCCLFFRCGAWFYAPQNRFYCLYRKSPDITLVGVRFAQKDKHELVMPRIPQHLADSPRDIAFADSFPDFTVGTQARCFKLLPAFDRLSGVLLDDNSFVVKVIHVGM